MLYDKCSALLWYISDPPSCLNSRRHSTVCDQSPNPIPRLNHPSQAIVARLCCEATKVRISPLPHNPITNKAPPLSTLVSNPFHKVLWNNYIRRAKLSAAGHRPDALIRCIPLHSLVNGEIQHGKSSERRQLLRNNEPGPDTLYVLCKR